MGGCHVTGERMAKILNFRSTERPENLRDTCGGESAQVIVFPGVRYERWDGERETKARRTPAAKRRRLRRDVIELAE